MLILYHLREVKRLDIAENLSLDVTTTKEKELSVVEWSRMSTASFGLLSGCIYSDPGALINIEEINIVKDSHGFTTSDHTEMRIIDSGCCMTCPRCRRLLTWNSGEKPASRTDVESKHVIKELMKVSSSKNVESTRGSLVCEINHWMARTRCWYGNRALYIILNLMPSLFFKVKIEHVIEKVGDIGTTHDPKLHLLIRPSD